MLGDGLLTEQFVVLRVSADPKPRDTILYLNAKRAIATANANRSESADLLEVERRMAGIVLELPKGPPGLLAHPFRQQIKELPKGRRCMVPQKSRPSPRLCAATAASAS